MKENLTLEKIGKLAGVSRSTVSRVINNQPEVSDLVRDRVLKIIKETGYQPNQAAKSLASRRSHILGLVIPRTVATFFSDPYFSRLTEGVAQACNELGYTLALFVLHTEEDEINLIPRVSQQGFLDGVIVQATTEGDPIIPLMKKGNIPFLVVGRLPDMDPELSFIDVDNQSSAYSAVTHLARLGYKRIGHITGPLNNRPAIDRKVGYEQAIRNRNLPLHRELITEGDFTEESGYYAAQRLLTRKPDAIFVASDSMAIGAIKAIREANLSVPNDIAIVGFDDLPPARYSIPPLTTIRQPILRLGIKAIETLIDIIENQDQTPIHLIYNTELIIRESCGSNIKDLIAI